MIYYTSDNYNEAVAFKAKQRRLTPPLFNVSRLLEQPMPDISQPNASIQHADIIEHPQLDDNLVVEQVHIDANDEGSNSDDANGGEYNGFVDDEGLIDVSYDGVNIETESDPLQIKLENIEIFNENNAEEFIDDNTNGFNAVKIDDDVEMFFASAASFKPMTEHVLQVKQNDTFSGKLPFYIDVSVYGTE